MSREATRALWVLGIAVLQASVVGAQSAEPCPLRFADIATNAGLVFTHDPGARGDKHLPETMGSGLAWLDFDGDGRLDLFAVQSGPFPPSAGPEALTPQPPLPGGEGESETRRAGLPRGEGLGVRAAAEAQDRLWRQRLDGTFEDWTSRAGLDQPTGDAREPGYGQGVLAADLDGDGWTDLYVTRFGPDAVWRNRGDGTFERVENRWGIEVDGWSSSAAAADFDGDGDLDLYVTRYLVYDPADELFCGDLERGERAYCDPTLFAGAHDVLLRREGDDPATTKFVDITAAAGLGNAAGKGLGVLFTDLDGDQLADLYVANDLTENLLFQNRGDGTFEDLSLLSGAAANREGKYEAGMGLAVGDLDGDGDPDLGVTNFDVETNTLYRNLGGLFFEDIAASSGFGVPSFNRLGFGIVFADLDLDADLDVWVANGHIFEQPKRRTITHAQPDLVLLGDGRGGFTNAPCAWLAETPRVGRGLAAGDADNDGDVDVAVLNNAGPLQMWRNLADGAPAASWLGVVLRSGGLNSQAVGAQLRLLTGEASPQSRQVLAGESYQSTSDRRALFGLSGARPQRLEILWPSGTRQVLVGLPADRWIHLRGVATPP